jgi:hypothetical protein
MNDGGVLGLEEDIAVFDAFESWLYTSRIKDPPNDPKNVTALDKYLGPNLLCRIWVFADMRGIQGLENDAIDMLHERMASMWMTYIGLTNYFYESTIPGGCQWHNHSSPGGKPRLESHK